MNLENQLDHLSQSRFSLDTGDNMAYFQDEFYFWKQKDGVFPRKQKPDQHEIVITCSNSIC